jgi:hypothetical protein
VLGADRVGHQLLRPLDHLPGGGPVVEPGAGQHVVAEDVLAQHGPHPRVRPAALLVPGRGERGVLAPVVLLERVQHGCLVVVHAVVTTPCRAG